MLIYTFAGASLQLVSYYDVGFVTQLAWKAILYTWAILYTSLAQASACAFLYFLYFGYTSIAAASYYLIQAILSKHR
ncbi:hypothetical protein A3841_08095 [Pontibacter flavimaris]|uniref:Uncharacterized protein n=1 Tax=Pontibacter flavimaris TaxID=1797110 RepID=A0A1Q5PIC3_9BACT|nr:hypothetical protein A3841_08095 [Pontibacter flavimaris]